MEAAYCGVFIWANAVKQAGAPDPEGVLQAVGGQTFDGPGGTIRIDPDNQHAWKTARLGKIRPDGQFEIVYTSPQAIRPQPFPPTRTRRAWELLLNSLYLEWGNQWAAPAKP
jgi:urea transport system substrate-binding protein